MVKKPYAQKRREPGSSRRRIYLLDEEELEKTNAARILFGKPLLELLLDEEELAAIQPEPPGDEDGLAKANAIRAKCSDPPLEPVMATRNIQEQPARDSGAASTYGETPPAIRVRMPTWAIGFWVVVLVVMGWLTYELGGIYLLGVIIVISIAVSILVPATLGYGDECE